MIETSNVLPTDNVQNMPTDALLGDVDSGACVIWQYGTGFPQAVRDSSP